MGEFPGEICKQSHDFLVFAVEEVAQRRRKGIGGYQRAALSEVAAMESDICILAFRFLSVEVKSRQLEGRVETSEQHSQWHGKN
jgi:hypothetical protein